MTPIPVQSSDLALAISLLRQSGAGFVIVKAQREIAQSPDHGIGHLLEAVERLRAQGSTGAALADRVVGRAAALLAVWGGIQAVHGEVMSEGALGELEARSLTVSHSERVPHIVNRNADGPCPFETAVREATTPDDAVVRVRDVLVVMRAQAAADHRLYAARGAHWVAGAGIGLALAVTLPLALHPLGLGPALLPMHLPVLLTGALAGPRPGLLTGLLAPGLSHLVTGMPPIAPPIAPLMTFELATYGLTAGLVRRLLLSRLGHKPAGRLGALAREYLWIIAAMLAGRIALGLAAAALGPTLGLKVSAMAYVGGALITGVPGLIVQVVVIPPLVMRIRR